MTINQSYRLSIEEFRAIIKKKGWTYKELAVYWDCSAVWLSHIARNPERPIHYDDAVFGLPYKHSLSNSLDRRQQTANMYLAKQNEKRRRRKTKQGGKYDYFSVGTILSVAEDVWSLADAGIRAVIFDVRKRKREYKFGVIFENGLFDWFAAEDMEKYMIETGLTDDLMKGFKFTSEDHLADEFSKNRINFRP